jgi:hypothetical protein
MCVRVGLAYHQYAKIKVRLENAQAKINEVQAEP